MSFPEKTDTHQQRMFRWGACYSLQQIADSIGLRLEESYTADDVHDESLYRHVLGRVLTLPLDQQVNFFRRYTFFLYSNRANIKAYYAPALVQKLEQGQGTFGYYQGSHLTSFPAEELAAMDYLKAFRPEALKKETEYVQSVVPALTEDLPNSELFNLLDQSAQRLLTLLRAHVDVQEQMAQELRLYFYRALLTRPGTPVRDVRLSETTSRDGQQSNIGTNLTGSQQLGILQRTFRYGNIHRVETWGGATTQSALLPTKRNGQPPEDPFFNLRAQTKLLHDVLLEAFGTAINQLDAKDRSLVEDRFRVDTGRRILAAQELDALLQRNRITPATQAKVKKVYRIKQEMLLRGQYIVGLQAYPDDILKMFIRTAYKNGVDVFRIFDAFNDVRRIEKAVQFARETGASVQPVIHYTTGFPTGIEGYVRVALQLVDMGGNDLDSLAIKDAGGLLEPNQAHTLIKALRDAGIKASLQVHTHDVAGNRQLTLLEAIRANGEEYPITVDVASGELAGPFAQPNARHFLNLVQGTAWDNGLTKDLDAARMQDLEQYVAREILPVLPIAPITTRQRERLLFARLPGGMKTNFDNDLGKALAQRSYIAPIEQHLGLKIMEENTFTRDGIRFREAFMDLVYQEMRRITEDMGGVSLVTPTSEWIGKQAYNNVMGWAVKGHLVKYVDGDRAWTLTLKHSFEESPRLNHYRASLVPLRKDLQDYIVERAQTPELIALYPRINKEVEAWVLDMRANDPLPVAKSTEDFKREFAKARESNPEINDTDEDFLLWALFPNPDQFYHLIRERRRLRQALADTGGKDGSLKAALFQSGADPAASTAVFL